MKHLNPFSPVQSDRRSLLKHALISFALLAAYILVELIK